MGQEHHETSRDFKEIINEFTKDRRSTLLGIFIVCIILPFMPLLISFLITELHYDNGHFYIAHLLVFLALILNQFNTNAALDFLNPKKLKESSDIKNTDIVLLLESIGGGLGEGVKLAGQMRWVLVFYIIGFIFAVIFKRHFVPISNIIMVLVALAFIYGGIKIAKIDFTINYEYVSIYVDIPFALSVTFLLICSSTMLILSELEMVSVPPAYITGLSSGALAFQLVAVNIIVPKKQYSLEKVIYRFNLKRGGNSTIRPIL